MAKPDKINYIGKVFDRKDGDQTRKVVSFDKGVKHEDGSWSNIPPAFIEYEDGERIHFGSGPLTLKYLEEVRGNHVANIYQAIWPKKKEEGGDEEEDFSF